MAVKPTQVCQVCFEDAFKRRTDGELTALFVYPCDHVFHRECIRSFLHKYQTKNQGLKTAVDFIEATFSKIDDICYNFKGRERVSDPESAKSTRPSLLDSLKKLLSVRSEEEASKPDPFVTELSEEQKEQMLPLLDQIDSILRRDGILCGTLLLDMIDNDFAEGEDHQDLESGQALTYNKNDADSKTKTKVWQYADADYSEQESFL